MRRVRFLTLSAAALTCLMAAPAGRSAPGPSGTPRAHRTIEPILPVTIDLRVAHVTRGPVGGTARLVASIDADRSAGGVEISLRLPPGVSVDDGDLEPGQRLALGSSGHRVLRASLRAERDADLPIQIEASFHLPDGTPLVSRQGITLPFGPRRPPGRIHLGAYEMMGVPLQDLSR